MATFSRTPCTRSAAAWSLLAGCLLYLPALALDCAGGARASEAVAEAAQPAAPRVPVCVHIGRVQVGGEVAEVTGSTTAVLEAGTVEIPDGTLPEGAVEIAFLADDATAEELSAPCAPAAER